MIRYNKCLFFSLAFLLKLVNGTSVLQTEQCTCTKDCPENEEFSECGNNGCQNTCANPRKSWVCKAACRSGCVCIEGYLRNSEGICVPVIECDACGENEIFSACDDHSCRNTCSEPNRITYCDYEQACYPGCICIDGFLKNDEGKCVPQDLCVKKCKENEVYTMYDNHPCRDTCTNPDLSTRCSYIPGPYPGCICADGFLKNDDNVCVPRKECELCAADKNTVFAPCGDVCPVTCQNKDKGPRICPDICKVGGGCRCKTGYVRDIHGICILEKDCPICGANEVFACGSACDTTCATLGQTCPIVNKKCNDKCYCIDGYARNNKNVCIPIKQCPLKKCPVNQVYNLCPIYCPPEQNCKDYIEGRIYDCAQVPEDRKCVPRCECKPGFIRKVQNGDCIKPEQCCSDPNAEMVNCPNPCPGGTCESPEFSLCYMACQLRGCQCKKGYVKNKDGKCILLSACPKMCMGKNMEYKSCGSACPSTCDNFYKDIICTEQCVPGCFCKKGFTLNKYKECVLYENCPIPKCQLNEVYQKCPGCSPEKTCYHYFNDIRIGCTASSSSMAYVCTPSCRCNPDYIRSDQGKCVLPKNCCADKNAEVVNCPNPCPGGTCLKPSFDPCKQKCNPKGCQCKKGYLKKSDTDSSCILSSKCKTLTYLP